MGEIADMIVDGEICMVCGCDLAEVTGYPTTCGACGSIPKPKRKKKKKKPQTKPQ